MMEEMQVGGAKRAAGRFALSLPLFCPCLRSAPLYSALHCTALHCTACPALP